MTDPRKQEIREWAEKATHSNPQADRLREMAARCDKNSRTHSHLFTVGFKFDATALRAGAAAIERESKCAGDHAELVWSLRSWANRVAIALSATNLQKDLCLAADALSATVSREERQMTHTPCKAALLKAIDWFSPERPHFSIVREERQMTHTPCKAALLKAIDWFSPERPHFSIVKAPQPPADTVMVPREATATMCGAAMRVYSEDQFSSAPREYPDFFHKLYKAMLAAAPAISPAPNELIVRICRALNYEIPDTDIGLRNFLNDCLTTLRSYSPDVTGGGEAKVDIWSDESLPSRLHRQGLIAGEKYSATYRETMHEAADEIDRLTTALRSTPPPQGCSEERLRSEVGAAIAGVTNAIFAGGSGSGTNYYYLRQADRAIAAYRRLSAPDESAAPKEIF